VRPPPPVPVLEPDPRDPRLAEVGDHLEAWADGELLTLAARRPGRLTGTFYDELLPAGDGLWARRFRVARLARACIEYALEEPEAVFQTWRGPRAPAAAPWTPLARVPRRTLGAGELEQAHPVSLWLPEAEPRALLVCADGDAATWRAGFLAAAGEPVALLGISSGAISHRIGETYAYDVHTDRRARAYIERIDPPYFAAHMRYVVETVLPWAAERVDPALPRIAFGVSNGAAWSASAGVRHPEVFAAVLAFSIGNAPGVPVPRDPPPFALVAGRLEPGFDRTTTSFACALRAQGGRVRLRRPVRGHDSGMWSDELVPSLRWALQRVLE
jgi:hypothetical protein